MHIYAFSILNNWNGSQNHYQDLVMRKSGFQINLSCFCTCMSATSIQFLYTDCKILRWFHKNSKKRIVSCLENEQPIRIRNTRAELVEQYLLASEIHYGTKKVIAPLSGDWVDIVGNVSFLHLQWWRYCQLYQSNSFYLPTISTQSPLSGAITFFLGHASQN